MRLSMLRASVVATAAAAALTACAGHGIVPSSQTALDPVTSDVSQMTPDAGLNSVAVTTCAKSPPQYGWIFKGACTNFVLKPTGTPFKLQAYRDITVTGSIGANDVKGTAKIYLADAVDKSDIENFGGKKFLPYKAKGTTFIYAAADNQTTQAIKPKVEKNKPILQYVITDSHGLPGKTCGAALLTEKSGKFFWSSLPNGSPVKGKTVTITVFAPPPGFELPPKGSPLYFAVNCF
jgi:hypothetical protein